MKTITIESVGEVVIRKSSRAKRIILKINSDGSPSVTIPRLAPYIVGERFARQHADWFIKNKSLRPSLIIFDGKKIGNTHTITFVTGKSLGSRVARTTITVTVPSGLNQKSPVVQAEAKKAAIRALRRQAEQTLPGMVHTLAQKHGYSYNEVRIKAVQTRWGSCSSGRIINLSVWLMQVPSELIEYVICHELTHLHHMHHQAAFWEELATMIPDYKARRKALKSYRPQLI